MKGKSAVSAIFLAALAFLAVGSAVGPRYVEWEWWAFVNILSSMALFVALVLEVARMIWAAVQ